MTPQDVVYDLGAGDGKIAIAAGKIGATSVGIEYNPDMAKLAQCYVQAEGARRQDTHHPGRHVQEDFSKATVVTMYLLPELNLRAASDHPEHEARHARDLAPVHDGRLGSGRNGGDRLPDRISLDRSGQGRRHLDLRDRIRTLPTPST